MIRQNIDIEKLLAEKGVKINQLKASLQFDDLQDVLYFSGSLLDGVGDESSDLDLYLLTPRMRFKLWEDKFAVERRHQQQRREFGIYYLSINDIEIDVEIHPIEKFNELFSALREFNPDNSNELQESFDSLGKFERSEALDLLHRFRIGNPIVNHSAFNSLFSHFDEDKFLRWNVRYFLELSQDFKKGIGRSLVSGDSHNAYLKLTRLYDSLVDAYLFANGVSIDRWKWRLAKLRMLEDESILNDYLDVQMLRKNTSESLDSFVSKMVSKGDRFSLKIKDTLKKGIYSDT